MGEDVIEDKHRLSPCNSSFKPCGNGSIWWVNCPCFTGLEHHGPGCHWQRAESTAGIIPNQSPFVRSVKASHAMKSNEAQIFDVSMRA